MKKLTPQQHSEIAKHAALARWTKKKSECSGSRFEVGQLLERCRDSFRVEAKWKQPESCSRGGTCQSDEKIENFSAYDHRPTTPRQP